MTDAEINVLLERLDRTTPALRRRITAAFVEKAAQLEDAIAAHRAQKADDRCIEDDDRLYAAAGLPPCDRRAGRCWPTYADLEAEIAKLRILNEGLAERVAKQSDLLSRRAEKPQTGE